MFKDRSYTIYLNHLRGPCTRRMVIKGIRMGSDVS